MIASDRIGSLMFSAAIVVVLPALLLAGHLIAG